MTFVSGSNPQTSIAPFYEKSSALSGVRSGGAFVYWAFKGFSTSFEEELNGGFLRNVIAAFILWGTLGVLLFLIFGK